MVSKDYQRELRPPARSNVRYGQIYSKFSRFQHQEAFGAHPAWYDWYRRNLRCPCCLYPRREWQENPVPIEPELTGSFPGCSTGAHLCPADLWREDLRAVLKPFLPNAVWGRCYLGHGEGRVPLPFFTLQVSRSEQVYPYRGPARFPEAIESTAAGHYACPDCGRIQGFGDISEAFSDRDVQGRPLVVDIGGSIYIRGELETELKLRERFEDLRLYMIPVIKEPADGWTLPNDTGWDGTLRPPEGFGKIPPFPCLRPGD